MFDNVRLNNMLAGASLFPLTVSIEDEPKLGLVYDWDSAGNIYRVEAFPITVSCPN